MQVKSARLFITLLLALNAGCASRSETKGGTIAVSWSADIAHGLQKWREVIEADIGPCIILEAHGEYNLDGVWCRFADDGSVVPWETIVKLVRDLHPDTPIVLLSCNARGHVIRTPRVYFPRAIAWSHPNLSPFRHHGVTRFEQFAYSGEVR
jgi:hypothetical protein